MTIISLRPALRLVVAVILLLLTGPFHGCQSLAPPDRSADVGRRPPGFTEIYPYTDGIDIQVTDIWVGRKLGFPIVELTIPVQNGTAHTFEARIKGDLRYGTYRLPTLRYVSPPGPDDSGNVQLIAIGADSDPYRLSFILPPGSHDHLTFNVAIDAGIHDPAVFVGGL